MFAFESSAFFSLALWAARAWLIEKQSIAIDEEWIPAKSMREMTEWAGSRLVDKFKLSGVLFT